jgi:hypothetical protein
MPAAVASRRGARDDGRVISVGLRLVAVRSKAGDVWEVVELAWAGMWRLRLDRAGRAPVEMTRTTDELRDVQHWRELEAFPAPREQDCEYGCCRAGDVGLYSEVVSAGARSTLPV